MMQLQAVKRSSMIHMTEGTYRLQSEMEGARRLQAEMKETWQLQARMDGAHRFQALMDGGRRLQIGTNPDEARLFEIRGMINFRSDAA